MRILVLGGTRFVGEGIVGAAAAQGHTLTLLHRGLSARTSGATRAHEHLIADRTRPETLAILEGRRWDAVVDVSGYEPADVRRVATMLAGSVGRYLFVSTAAVHRGPWGGVWDEETTLVEADEDTYGARKRRCEDTLLSLYGQRCTVLRPSIVVGQGDPDDRLGHWLRRAQGGGVVLAPGRPDQPIQLVDRDDFGGWVVRCIEHDLGGPMLVAGRPIASETFFEECAQATARGATFRFVKGRDLAHAGVRSADLPDFVPYWSKVDDLAPVLSVRRAEAAGFCASPLSQSIARLLPALAAPTDRYLTASRDARLLALAEG